MEDQAQDYRMYHSGSLFQSVGPPPEKHADRVMAETMREMAAAQASTWEDLKAIVRASSDGAPAGQRKMQEKMKRAGAFYTKLWPGKRGKYKLLFCTMGGWDVQRDGPITPKDRIPQKPWTVCYLSCLESSGNGRRRWSFHANPIVFITHHSLSRAAQRCEVRTQEQLIDTIVSIFTLVLKKYPKEEVWEEWLNAPPQGRHERTETDPPFTVVFQKHPKLKALVAATTY